MTQPSSFFSRFHHLRPSILLIVLGLIVSLMLTACSPVPQGDKAKEVDSKGSAQAEQGGEPVKPADEAGQDGQETVKPAEKAGQDGQETAKPAEKADPDEQETASAALQEDETAKQGKVQQGGAIKVGITQEPDFLDPHLAVAAGTKEILFNIFQGLVRLSPEGAFEPCLATSWEVEEEGLAYRFFIREGVKFHNGQELRLDDIVFSLKRAAGLLDQPALVAELSELTGVEADPETHSVLVRQKEINPDLISLLTTAIIPADYEDQTDQPVGTGPFKLQSYTPQVSLVLERFADYWEEGKPYLDQVTFQIYGDMDAAYLELMAGQIDIFPYLTAEKAASLADKYQLVAGGANMLQLMAFNNDREPLDNPLVREAINLAIDRAKLVEMIMGEYGRPVVSAMTPSMGPYYNESLLVACTANPEAAKEKLAEAGYPEGLELTVTVPANYLIHVDTANILAAQLAKAGIKLSLENVEWGTWLERVYAGRDYQMTVIALTYDYFTPSDVLNRYMQEAPDNFINYQSEAYDELAKAAAREVEEGKRQEMYREMQALLLQDHASAFLQEPFNVTAVKKGLTGYVQYPAYVLDMSTVALLAEAAE